MKSIELNEGLKSIGLNAFANCVSLTGKIVIPSTVTSFGSSSIDAGPFYNTAITELVIKEGTEPLEIQARSFAGCYQLHTVDLPARVTCIGNSAFDGAISLENFYWASGDWEQKIESFAFEGTRLSSFEAPNRLTSIGSYAFRDMTTLETVVLNDKLQSIGSGAF